jgi:hypothetical protein
VDADSALAAAALSRYPALHPVSLIANIDAKLRSPWGLRRLSAHDPGHYVAGLEEANLEHAATFNHSHGRAVQRITESLLQLA